MSLSAPLATALALAALLPAAPAHAQALDRSDAVDAYAGLAIGEGRSVGLGGAYVAVAEGLGGTGLNPAAVAHRRRDLRRRWDLDGAFSVSTLRTDQDLDNDGGREAALSGYAHLSLGGGLQWKRLGFGALLQGWLSRGPKSEAGSIGIDTADLVLSSGYSALHDALVVGAAVTLKTGAVVQYRPDGEEARRLEYGAQTFGAGALWRPRGRPFRLGASFTSGGRARPEQDAPADFTGPTPRAFAFPWVAAVGASIWLGPNAHLYNEPALQELEAHPEARREVAYDPAGVQPVLLAAQLDVVGPVDGAVTVASALSSGGPARRSGRHASLVPHAGAEWEAFRRWLRLRCGYYLEPSRTGGASRSHATFGAEARIPFWPWPLQVGFAGDVAERYTNLGVSLGLWSDRAPLAPPPLPDAAD